MSVARIIFWNWYNALWLFYLKEAVLFISLAIETIHYITQIHEQGSEAFL
jgi:hypothetical protein